MDELGRLLEQAARCRRIAPNVDEATKKQLLALACKYDTEVRELEERLSQRDEWLRSFRAAGVRGETKPSGRLAAAPQTPRRCP
jgi:hypothetical protein